MLSIAEKILWIENYNNDWPSFLSPEQIAQLCKEERDELKKLWETIRQARQKRDTRSHLQILWEDFSRYCELIEKAKGRSPNQE
ncbi:MAG: hypothetical protein V2A63_04795 [Patescibacteria group bacterium]